jgi:hypothetical protein
MTNFHVNLELESFINMLDRHNEEKHQGYVRILEDAKNTPYANDAAKIQNILNTWKHHQEMLHREQYHLAAQKESFAKDLFRYVIEPIRHDIDANTDDIDDELGDFGLTIMNEYQERWLQEVIAELKQKDAGA